jgi:hypothetical protein
MGFDKGLSPKESEADYVKSNEQEYRNIIKHAPIGIYEMDFFGTKFRSVNDRFCQVQATLKKNFAESFRPSIR